MTNPPYDDQRAPRFLAYPYSLSGQGTPNTSGAEEHLRQLILQVLFTSPGERVNLPEFGAGVQRLVFAPSGDVLRASARYLITTSLQRWLGDRIEVEQVTVSSEPGLEETVTIEIAYRVRATRQSRRLLVQVEP